MCIRNVHKSNTAFQIDQIQAVKIDQIQAFQIYQIQAAKILDFFIFLYIFSYFLYIFLPTWTLILF